MPHSCGVRSAYLDEISGFCAKFVRTVGKRSPVLGYNHNFKHRGLIFHVQTEDSGVDNPHLFTHLFHGGVIISSRKIDYDAESEVDIVKSLMQSQHKAVAKDLKIGTFDNKIDSYLGNREDLEPRKPDSAAGPAVEDTDPDAEAHLEPMDETKVSAAPSDMLDLDAGPEIEDPEGLTFDAAELEPAVGADIAVDGASTDEMPTIASLNAGDNKSSTADVDTEAAIAVAEAQAAAAEARELAAQAAAEAEHARQLQEAAAAATARAAALEAKVAAHSKSQAHNVAAHSGAISLDGAAPPAPEGVVEKAARTTQTNPIVDVPDTRPRRRHLPTAVEMPAHTDESLGDPTVTFSSGPRTTPAPQAAPQAVPQQITGERSGTYSMKRQSTTQRMAKRAPARERGGTGSRPIVSPARERGGTGSGPIVSAPRERGRTGSGPVASPRGRTGSGPIETGPGTQRPRRTGANPVVDPARTARHSASALGKAANPEPGRPRSPVVVSRPAVIIGAPPKMVGKGGRKPAPRKARSGSVFGKDLISEKSLDEVIMAYLSEDSSED